MADLDFTDEKRKGLLKEAEGYLQQVELLERENQFDRLIEVGEKCISFCEKHQIWNYYVRLSVIVLNVYRLRSYKKNPALIQSFQELLELAKIRFGENHSLTAKVYLNLGVVFGASNRLHEGLDHFYKAEKIYLESDQKKMSLSLLTCYKYIGVIFKRMGNLLKAIEYHTKALNRGLELKTTNIISDEDMREKLYLQIVYASIDLGNDYYVLGNYDIALVHYQKALEFQTQNLLNNKRTLENTYYVLAKVYKQRGNYPLAILYYNESLQKCKEVYGKSSQYLIKNYGGLAICYNEIGEFQKAILNIHNALSITETLYGFQYPDTVTLYSLLAGFFLKQEDYPQAIKNLEKCLKIAKQVFGENHPQISEPYCLLGQAYTQLLDFDSAKVFLEKSLKVRLQTLGSHHPQVSDSYLYIGIMHQKQGNYKEALVYLQKAIVVFDASLSENDIYHIPAIKNYTPFRFYISILEQKASAFCDYYFHTTQQKQDYLASLLLYEIIDKLLSMKQKSFVNELSKLETSKLFSNVLGRYIQILFHTPFDIDNKFSKGFYLTEKVKAAVLHASLKENFAKTSSNISYDLLQKEEDIKKKLTYLDKTIQKEETKGAAKDEENLQTLQNEYFDLHQQYIQLIQHFEENYPDYYQLKYQTETVSVEAIQETLSDNQWMVSYFVGETHFYIFFIGKEIFEVLQYEKPSGFEALVEGFLQSIQQHQLEKYEQKAYELYQRLLQPVEVYLIDMLAEIDEEESNSIPQLIVIPHGILSYVPFEALVCTRPGRRYDEIMSDSEKNKAYQSLDYLLLHCEVTYHYSATLWHYLQSQNKGERADMEDGFVGFAPVYQLEEGSQKGEEEGEKSEKGVETVLKEVGKEVFQWATRSEALRSDGTWTALPHSKIEAQNIAALFHKQGLKSQTFLHEQATKERFREVVENSRFLLIAAHGVVNDERPKLSGLVFFPKIMENSPTPERFGDIWNGEGRKMSPKHPPNPLQRGNLNVGESSQTDCILSMEETYHLNLQNTDLVVLSSCESGIGTLAKGEGMMAVNRGFLYAGAKSVVSTLFKVYDKPSSLLTQYLFEGILTGKGYGESLREAKLRLLKLEEVDVKSWCGFVLIGG